jgi:hypothetical protein
MKFCTYNSTPGLDRYLVGQRYRVWNDAHKELMRTDSDYRRAVRRFTFQIIAATFVNGIISPAFTFLQHRFSDNTPLMVFSIVIPIAATFVYLLFVLHASFGIQCFQNERVARVLESR